MRVLLMFSLLLLCSCGILKKTSSSVKSSKETESISYTSEKDTESAKRVNTTTKTYGDSLRSQFTIPLDSSSAPVWIESSGISVGISTKVEDGKLKMEVSAISKPRTETQTTEESSTKSKERIQDISVKKKEVVTISQKTKERVSIPWYYYALAVAVIVFVVLKFFKKNIPIK
jgi:hypothetical protein